MTLADIHLLLKGEHVGVEELLQLLVDVVDAPSSSSETRSPRRMCRRCSLRSATPRMRTVCSPTCPSSTGSPARPKNPTKLQSQASKRPWQHGTLLKKI